MPTHLTPFQHSNRQRPLFHHLAPLQIGSAKDPSGKTLTWPWWPFSKFTAAMPPPAFPAAQSSMKSRPACGRTSQGLATMGSKQFYVCMHASVIISRLCVMDSQPENIYIYVYVHNRGAQCLGSILPGIFGWFLPTCTEVELAILQVDAPSMLRSRATLNGHTGRTKLKIVTRADEKSSTTSRQMVWQMLPIKVSRPKRGKNLFVRGVILWPGLRVQMYSSSPPQPIVTGK